MHIFSKNVVFWPCFFFSASGEYVNCHTDCHTADVWKDATKCFSNTSIYCHWPRRVVVHVEMVEDGGLPWIAKYVHCLSICPSYFFASGVRTCILMFLF